MPTKNNSKSKHKILYTKLASIGDLARYACNFAPVNKNIFASDLKKTIMVFGETIGDTTIVYYSNVEKPFPILTYAGGQGVGEKVEMLDSLGALEKPDMYYMQVVEIDGKGFKDTGKIKPSDFHIINVIRPEDIIKGLIRRSMENGGIEHVYIFQYKNETIICAFDVFEDLANGNPTLYYSKLKSGVESRFARYNYSKDSVDFSNDFGGHTYLYVKLIYLAHPFDFFKQ